MIGGFCPVEHGEYLRVHVPDRKKKRCRRSTPDDTSSDGQRLTVQSQRVDESLSRSQPKHQTGARLGRSRRGPHAKTVPSVE